MFSKKMRLGAVAAVLAASAAVPTPANAALGICQAAVSQSTGSETAVVLVGRYVDQKWRGVVTLTCHIVQNGVKVASASDVSTGSVAVVASDERIPPGPFTVCHEVRIFVPATMTHYYMTNC